MSQWSSKKGGSGGGGTGTDDQNATEVPLSPVILGLGAGITQTQQAAETLSERSVRVFPLASGVTISSYPADVRINASGEVELANTAPGLLRGVALATGDDGAGNIYVSARFAQRQDGAAHGLTVGAAYYADQANAGALTTTPPATNPRAVLFASSATCWIELTEPRLGEEATENCPAYVSDIARFTTGPGAGCLPETMVWSDGWTWTFALDAQGKFNTRTDTKTGLPDCTLNAQYDAQGRFTGWSENTPPSNVVGTAVVGTATVG